MAQLEIDPWEPEETVGKLWHGWASRLDAPQVHDDARVDLAEVQGRLGVFFRGLGGGHDVEIRAASDKASDHRMGWRRRLGNAGESLPHAGFDGEVLRLPQSLSVFPERAANAALYLWLTAAAAHVVAPEPANGPVSADLARIAAGQATVAATLAAAPGLTALYHELAAATLAMRPRLRLPPAEAVVENALRHALGDADAPPAPAALPPAARHHRPMRPVILWPDGAAVGRSATTTEGVETRPTDAVPEQGSDKMMRARRRASDQAARKDSLILYKFEAILSWAEFLNLNRRIEDDDDDSAKKAADDMDEIGLGQIAKAPATRLKLHLDLAPEDVDREALAGVHIYPEWDARAGRYLPGHVRVLESVPSEAEPPAFRDDPAAMRRIRAVTRQFQALRPGRQTLPGQTEGDELDMSATLRRLTDIRTGGAGGDAIWRQSRPVQRDLAVSILLDVSRSTESAVTGRAVIDIEREALAAMAWGLDACGDSFAIHAFSSLKRDRVHVDLCKRFDEPMNAAIEARIGALRPRFYTRLGAGIRHASAALSTQGRRRRLLLVITDGKPNDLDHYEGRHGIEDSAMAVREARRAGHAVFGVTVDSGAKSWFPRIFGRNGSAVVGRADHLTTALPAIYRQLVGG